MPPIPSAQLVTVELDYLRAKNTASEGSVEFTPPRFIVDGNIVTTRPVKAQVTAGEGTIQLIPFDGGTYQVTERLDNMSDNVFHINLPLSYAGTTRQLSSLAPVTPLYPGVSANTLRSGFGAPAAGTGFDGDYYYDITNKFWYGPKAVGAWPAGFSIVGPAGAAGSQGPAGAAGKTILNGTASPTGGVGTDGDFYLETDIMSMYGPKAAGAWPGGVSLIGPQGPQGNQGAQGPAGTPGSLGEDVLKIYGYHSITADLDTFDQAFGQNGELWQGTIVVRAGLPVDKIATFVDVAGVLGAGGVNGFAITSEDGQTLHYSVDDDTLWTSAGLREKTLGGSAIAPQATDKIYRVQLCVQGFTTAPQMLLAVNNRAMLTNFNGRARFQGGVGFQSGAGYNPVTFGGTTSGAVPLMMLG